MEAHSGHYRPSPENFETLVKILVESGADLTMAKVKFYFVAKSMISCFQYLQIAYTRKLYPCSLHFSTLFVHKLHSIDATFNTLFFSTSNDLLFSTVIMFT